MKEVGRIIGVLNLHQSLVIGTIAGPHGCRLILLNAQEVEVGSTGGKWLGRLVEIARPSDIGVCFTVSRLPGDRDLQGVVVLAQRKSGGCWIDTADRTVDMLEQDLRPGRRARGMRPDHGVEKPLGERVQRVGLTITLGVSYEKRATNQSNQRKPTECGRAGR
jgi:hypothetical protein